MTGSRMHQLPTRAFGAEPPIPGIPALAEWVEKRRGTGGDLTSYLLSQSLDPQREAGITLPCAGGKFYKARVMECLVGLDQGAAVAEIGLSPDPVVADAFEIAGMVRQVSVSMPAPHLLGIDDRYYHDGEEWAGALHGAYRTLMRAMRDAGCGGHVLICDRIDEAETAALSRKKVYFFHPSPKKEDLRVLLEHQRQVAVRNQDIASTLSLMDEYDITGIIIMDPDGPAIRSALEGLDPEKVFAGGYCTGQCPAYWKALVESAGYRS